jgi:hypothetical protein
MKRCGEIFDSLSNSLKLIIDDSRFAEQCERCLECQNWEKGCSQADALTELVRSIARRRSLSPSVSFNFDRLTNGGV